MDININIIKVLLVEDNLLYARIINDKLKSAPNTSFHITHVKRLNEGITKLQCNSYDAILLDLILPDSQGFETFLNIKEHAGDIPIILLTGLNDETIALKAMQEGAQDYLNKGEFSIGLLIKTIKYAIERQHLIMKLREKSLIDELTGLYNRRGFFSLGNKQISIANRCGNRFLLVFADLDKLKWINDNLGHNEGDNAIIDVANIFKGVFRESDIIGRIGGDEFVVIALDTKDEDISSIRNRIENAIERFNNESDRPYIISISIGFTAYTPKERMTLDELLSKADTEMYNEKKRKK